MQYGTTRAKLKKKSAMMNPRGAKRNVARTNGSWNSTFFIALLIFIDELYYERENKC